jgi:hypothetical protein
MGLLRRRGDDGGVVLAVRDTLYGDAPTEQWPPEGEPAGEFPWSAFVEARERLAAGSVEDAKRAWRDVLERPGLESRHYLQAWQFLRERGESPPPDVAKQVLGLVVEMALPEGLDVLALYADRSVRYYNHAGGAVVLDRAEGVPGELVDALLEAAAGVVEQIGPWEEARPGPPPRKHLRLSFLTPSGLHFGEGPTAALEREPMAAPIVQGATALVAELTGQLRSQR